MTNFAGPGGIKEIEGSGRQGHRSLFFSENFNKFFVLLHYSDKKYLNMLNQNVNLAGQTIFN